VKQESILGGRICSSGSGRLVALHKVSNAASNNPPPGKSGCDSATAATNNETSINTNESAAVQLNAKLRNLKTILAKEKYKPLGPHIGKECH
jgi:hypothetical protein